MIGKITTCWAITWRASSFSIDGTHQEFAGEANGTTRTALFSSRKKARKYVKEKYGYIAKRKDLQKYPYGWMTPKVVRVLVTIRMAKS